MTGLPVAAAGAIGLVAKATLVLSVALVLAWFARRGSARTLHLLWTTTFAVLLTLPTMTLLAPAWVLPVLPARTGAIEHRLPDQAASELPATADPVDPPVAGRQPDPVAPFPTGPVTSFPRADGSPPLTPVAGVFLVWVLGCGIGLVSLGVAARRFRKLVRGATPIRDPDWVRSTVRLRQRARVRGHTPILSSARVSTPMTGGPLRPVILLPESAENWTSGRREMVVSHELVHVRRRDALWRLVAGAVVALYWFHPLAWLASRLAAAARERSCDEEVLALGVRPSAYARHLYSLARELAPGPAVLSLPVVQHPHLESRIMSILKPHRPRFSGRRTYAALVVVVLAGVVAACARPVRMDPPASPAGQAETERPQAPPADNAAPTAIRAPAPVLLANRPPAESSATRPVAAAPAAPEPPGRQEVECEPGSFTGIVKNPESTTIQVSVDGMSLCMQTSGDVVMTGDGTAVAGMDPGSRLVLASRAERLHRMAITSGPDGLEYEWSIDGRSQPHDDEARAWRDLMLTVLARTREAWEVRGREASLRRQIGSHERHVASLRRQIGSHERHVAGLGRQTASHERHVAGLRRQIASFERHVAGLRRQIGSHERHVAGLHRQIGSHERQIASMRRQLASTDPRLVSLERNVREIGRRIERYDLAGKIRGIEARIERYDLDGKIRNIESRIARYDLDRRVRDIEAGIARYDLDGKIRGIEARIEEYDLDGRVRALEAEIEELDTDRRAEEIERSIQDDIAALRRLISTTGRRR